MTKRTVCWLTWTAAAGLAALAAGCGGGNGTPQPTPTKTVTPTPTRTTTALAAATATPTPPPSPMTPSTTPTQPSAGVTGLVVVNRSVAPDTRDGLGAPPAQWAGAPEALSFDRSLADADWSVDDVPDKHGVTGPDGQFALGNLPPGRHTLQVTKTVDGNLLPVAIPFTVGDDGAATVVAEVSLGLVRTTSTYVHDGVEAREVRGPYGTFVVISDGRVSELGDPARTLVDPGGDGQFDVQPCIDHVWECGTDRDCGQGLSCSCTASCPFCDDCGPPVCVPPLNVAPYRCTTDGSCAQPNDRCVCVSSCPDCDDCARSVCVPGCVPLEITAVTISAAPSQLVVGQQGSASATAQLSDGSRIDVTYLATWQSSDERVVTVDSWGTVSALGIGKATVTATLGMISSPPWPIEVVARPTLQRIDVQNVSCFFPLGIPTDAAGAPPAMLPATGNILPPIPVCGQVVQIGATIQFRAIGEFANGYYQDITDEVEWQVAPQEVGDVTAGLFTARQAGTAQLSATLEGVVSDPTQIRVVTQPTAVSLSIYADTGVIAYAAPGSTSTSVAAPCFVAPAGQSPSSCCCPRPLEGDMSVPCDCGYSVTVLRGDQLTFHATAQYDTGEFRDVSDQVSWRSSNTAAATIDAAGVMTAVDGGDATIDATLGDLNSNTVGVHVVNQATLQSIYIYQEGTDRVVAKGDQRFFTATGTYDVGFARDVTSAATWRSSDDSVGGFDTPGVFIARAAGTVEVWAELDGQKSNMLSLEVFETSELSYCDPANINRAVWSDGFNRVTLESDCDHYEQPGVAALRYTVTETQPHGGIFDPCLDLYVYQNGQRVRTIREEGCGEPFVPVAAAGRDEAVLKYQLRAFWDLKDETGAPVAPGTYTIYGRFYLYYDPVVSLNVTVGPGTGPLPTRTPTPTPRAPVVLSVGSATVVHGERTSFGVSLHTAGQPVAGVQNDLLFDPAVTVASRADGEPDCVVNPDIDKDATAFTFEPTGCGPGVDCKGIRAIVFAITNNNPISDGSLLYTCNVAVRADAAPGTYALAASHVVASDPLGNALPITATNGAIVVTSTPGEPPPPTATPTPPFPVCTPPPCLPGEVYLCPDRCPGGCGTICATPTPALEGVCFEGSSMCGGAVVGTSQSLCCTLARESASALPFSWCASGKVDPSTGQCAACFDDPCKGLAVPLEMRVQS